MIKTRMVMTNEGMVVYNIYRMCVNRSVPAIAGAKLVVSLSGEILSPKYAPDRMAPAVISNGMIMASAITIRAIPTVAEVVQLLPVATAIMPQIMTQVARKMVGFKIYKPCEIMVGMTPLISQ